MFYIRDRHNRTLDWEYNVIHAIDRAKDFIRSGSRGVHVTDGKKKVWWK